jgi:hypothetical protein
MANGLAGFKIEVTNFVHPSLKLSAGFNRYTNVCVFITKIHPIFGIIALFTVKKTLKVTEL